MKGRVLIRSHQPTESCSKCGKSENLDQLHQLPEVEDYVRKLGLAIEGLGEEPVLYNEKELLNRYGYGFRSLFCTACYHEITAKSPHVISAPHIKE